LSLGDIELDALQSQRISIPEDLHFVNRERSIRRTLDAFFDNRMIALRGSNSKTIWPVAAQTFGQGKTYFGDHFQSQVKVLNENNELTPFEEDFLQDIIKAKYVGIRQASCEFLFLCFLFLFCLYSLYFILFFLFIF